MLGKLRFCHTFKWRNYINGWGKCINHKHKKLLTTFMLGMIKARTTAHLWGGALSPLILPPCLSPILPARGGGGGGRSPGPRASLPCWAPISLAAPQAPCSRLGLPIMITLTIVTSSLPPAHQAHHLVSHPGITLVWPVWNNQCNDRSGNIHSTAMKPILYLKLTRDRPEW